MCGDGEEALKGAGAGAANPWLLAEAKAAEGMERMERMEGLEGVEGRKAESRQEGRWGEGVRGHEGRDFVGRGVEEEGPVPLEQDAQEWGESGGVERMERSEGSLDLNASVLNVSSLMERELACETSLSEVHMSVKDRYALALFRRALEVSLRSLDNLALGNMGACEGECGDDGAGGDGWEGGVRKSEGVGGEGLEPKGVGREANASAADMLTCAAAAVAIETTTIHPPVIPSTHPSRSPHPLSLQASSGSADIAGGR